jgi:type IV pilus assembly protein PilX
MSTPSTIRTHHSQQGAALAISLILLVVMTLLGLSSVRTIGQQEKMTSHAVDRSLVYQFAEAALREGEAQAQIQAQGANASFPTSEYPANGACDANALLDCASGLCATPDPDCTPRWLNPNFNRWQSYNGLAAVTNANGNTLIGTAQTGLPEYFIEILRPVGAAVCTTPPGPGFDVDCNRRYPDPDNDAPCGSCPPTSGTQCCNFYRYRVTARVQPPGRAAVIVQSVYSVQPQ